MSTPKVWPDDVRERFFSHVRITTGCWYWMGATSTDGYGTTGTGQRTDRGSRRIIGAHRFAYLLAHELESLSRKIDVMHSCDNKLCVNVAHLRTGSRRDNIRDMCAKGRAKPGTRPGVSRARLSSQQVITIRKKYASGLFTLGELAREYKVTHKTIADLINRKSWKAL